MQRNARIIAVPLFLGCLAAVVLIGPYIDEHPVRRPREGRSRCRPPCHTRGRAGQRRRSPRIRYGRQVRTAPILALAAALILLSGCSTGGIDWDARIGDEIGTWKVVGVRGAEAEVEFGEDFEFTASRWPVDLCKPSRPTDRNEIDWESTIEFSGRWEILEGPYSGYLVPDDPDLCASFTSFYFVRMNSDRRMRIYLESVDAARPENVIEFVVQDAGH